MQNKERWYLNEGILLEQAQAAIAAFPEKKAAYAGRGQIAFYPVDQIRWVIRRYHRGGLMRHFFKTYYFYRSCLRSRAWQEFAILDSAMRLGLPVPYPIAAYLKRHYFFYEAALIMKEIPQTKTLAQVLTIHPLSKTQWEGLFTLINRFHDLGFYHADLNAHNILIDARGKFWLIDFDKARQGTLRPRHRLNNKKRLLRSCLKLKKNDPKYSFGENEKNLFLAWF